MGRGLGAHHHRLALPATAQELLPTAEAIRAAKDAALSGMAAELANQPWPPGPEAHWLLDEVPLIALAVLADACAGVAIERLARALGLDPLDGPAALSALRRTDAWPTRAWRAARAALQGGAS
jgi:hypothetical protein